MSTWPPSRWSSTWSSWLPDEEGDANDEDKNVDGGDDDCWHNLSFLQRDWCEMKLYWLLKRLFQLNSTGGKRGEGEDKGGKKVKKSKLGSIFCPILSILDFLSIFYHNPLYCFHAESLAYSNGRRNVFIAKVETISRVQTKFGRDSYLSLNIQL